MWIPLARFDWRNVCRFRNAGHRVRRTLRELSGSRFVREKLTRKARKVPRADHPVMKRPPQYAGLLRPGGLRSSSAMFACTSLRRNACALIERSDFGGSPRSLMHADI